MYRDFLLRVAFRLGHALSLPCRYVNRELLGELRVQYYCTLKGTHKLVTLTTDADKDNLNKAENALRGNVIMENFVISKPFVTAL